MFPSTTLPFSSCRTVGFVRRSSAPIFGSGYPVPFTSYATLYHGGFHKRLLSRSGGRAAIHQFCSLQLQASRRRKVSFAIVSGPAASHALSGKARSLAHGQNYTLQPGPEVLCNKNRFGTDPVKARCSSARRVKSDHRKRRDIRYLLACNRTVAKTSRDLVAGSGHLLKQEAFA